MSGEFIIFEGIDGCGKSTQIELLKEKFKEESVKYELLHFPAYETIYGELIKKYLNGELGSMKDLPVEIPCLLYAMDRLNQRKRIKQLLRKGVHVLCDRYYGSGIAYQTAKYESEEESSELKEWIEVVESRIPKPSITILLDVPAGITQTMMNNRKMKDVHENDLNYQERVRSKFLQLAGEKSWNVINCYDDNNLRSKKSIHEEVWSILKKKV